MYHSRQHDDRLGLGDEVVRLHLEQHDAVVRAEVERDLGREDVVCM